MATTVINTTPEQDARIVVAFGDRLGLKRNATANEIKSAIINYVTSVVLDYEQREAARAAAQAVAPINPT